MAKKKAVKKAVTAEPTNLDIARKAINKKYGEVISPFSQAGIADAEGNLILPTISTGSIGLDVALGRGGFAMGRIYEVYGSPSSGKTTLTMSLMAQAQLRGLKCLYVDAEHSADPKLFEAMGVNLDEVEYLRAYTGDDNLDALEIIVKSNAADIAVVDSVAALIPAAESEAEIGKEFMGLHARLMSKAMRRLSQVAEQTNTLLVFINQTRYKIGAMGDPTTTTGGEALSFYSTGRILVAGGEYKSSRIVDPDGVIVGHQTKFTVKKNKLAPPFREAIIPLIYGVGYDSKWECLTVAENLGILDKSGSWYSYKGEKIGNGAVNVLAEIKANDELYNSIYGEILDLTGLKEVYEQNS